jgi:hypothetical protein
MAQELFAAMNLCRYAYLREMSEPGVNQLRLVIEEAAPSRKLETRVVEGVAFTDLRALESDEFSRIFEVTWDSYIAYTVRNETTAAFDPYEVIVSGRLACLYSTSRFLDYIALSTNAASSQAGPVRHVAMHCLNHIVDVASAKLPVVRELRQRHSPHMVV